MSAPTSEGNPWLSLADLLRIRTTVATLATAIEAGGIQTYDRFGRRIAATDENAESRNSKARALDLLASYFSFITTEQRDETFDPDSWFEYDSPLQGFGWPADEAPKFDAFTGESVPEAVARLQHRLDEPVATRTRRTFLSIIAALCKASNIDHRERGAAQRIKEATELIGATVSDDTIKSILNDIPDALEARMK